MAEMLVRLFDKYTGKDPVMHSKTTKRGDVIVVREDGWEWSPLEQKSPDWIIIKVDMPIEKARAMLASEQGPMDKQGRPINPLLQLRAFKVDLDALTVMGYPIHSNIEALALKFPATQKGIDTGTKDITASTDPIADAIAAVLTGDREEVKDDSNSRDVAVIEIKEDHFDKANVAKASIADEAIIGTDDIEVIG